MSSIKMFLVLTKNIQVVNNLNEIYLFNDIAIILIVEL